MSKDEQIRRLMRQIALNDSNIIWLDSKQDIDVPTDRKSLLSAAIFDQAREHHKSIMVLFKLRYFGSGLALVRPLFESYLRGLWIQRCADEREIKKFIKSKDIKPVQYLIDRIEKTAGFESGILSASKKSIWHAACGFTHSGFEQASRRLSEDDIGPNYDLDEIIQSMKAVLAYDFMTFLAMCELGSNNELANEVLERFRLSN
ncbi:DUF6988 family protein [Thalassobaculum sp.]|uniref:DUF6988 family protein n=1 Tax=Thalassobaculum sp. TaxID=2022740 RepID=UPI003B5A4330